MKPSLCFRPCQLFYGYIGRSRHEGRMWIHGEGVGDVVFLREWAQCYFASVREALKDDVPRPRVIRP